MCMVHTQYTHAKNTNNSNKNPMERVPLTVNLCNYSGPADGLRWASWVN